MLPEILGRITTTVLDTIWGFLPSAIGFAIIFSVLSLFSSQACNPGRTWWRNPGLFTDICYMVIIPFMAPYLRMSLLVTGAGVLASVTTTEQIADYFERGRGPLAGPPFAGQGRIHKVASDFLLYWAHRAFHGARFWRFPPIH